MLALLLLVGCSLQDRLLYYPDRKVPSDEELARHGMSFWPAGREGYRGFVGAMPAGRAQGTVIVLHGNAATASDRKYYLEPLRRLGYRVVLAEYPGYGARPGEPGEEAFVRDVRATASIATGMYGAPLYLVGESLGGAVAAAVVRETRAVAGLILVTPWSTLERVAQETFPWLPVRFFMTDRYDTKSNLTAYQGPVAIVAAERDTIVPPHHARDLFDSFPGRKRFWTVPGADHNDWPAFITDATWREIVAFVSTAGADRAP